MEVKAEKSLKLNQEPAVIWKCMIDPSFMVKSVPGAELTEQIDERNFKGKISVKIGPVTTNFNGEAEFTKLEEADYELTMEGKGLDTSGKGGANMTMNIKLSTLEDGGTEMQSSMSLSITGRLAQFGARMIVDPDTGLVGTVGGGCGEAEVIEAAYRVIETGKAQRVNVDLTDDLVSWSPAVCGGVMDIFVEPVSPERS